MDRIYYKKDLDDFRYILEALDGEILEKAWNSPWRLVPDIDISPPFLEFHWDPDEHWTEILEQYEAERIRNFFLKTRPYCPKDWHDFK